MRPFNRGRHYRKPALWKRVIKWSVVALLVVVFTAGLAGFFFVYHTLGKVGQNTQVIEGAKTSLDIPPPDQPENILVMGADKDPDSSSHRSDTLMLVRVDPQGNTLSVLSIPRDLIVQIPGHGSDKINAAYSYGGVPLAIETVRKLTGEPIHHFVVMDFDGFSKAVDALGGIYVDVDHRYYNDNSDAAPGEGYDPIDVMPGYQRLNGQDALHYVRFRHTDSDFMRIRRQQYFLRDAKAQSMQWGNVTKLPELADVFASNTTSDIDRGGIISLSKFLVELNKEHIYQVQAPIYESGNQVLLDATGLARVMKDFESPRFDQPDPAVPGAPARTVPSDNTRKVSVAVMNGGSKAGAASLAAGMLKRKGFTTISVAGDTHNSYSDNEVYYTEGFRPAANELSTLLKPCKVEPLPEGLATKSQLLVIVGNNFGGDLTQRQPEMSPALHFQQDSITGKFAWQSISLKVPFRIEKPTDFPREFSYAGGGFYSYNISTDDGSRPALKVVGKDQSGDYWGIMETTFTDAPLLQAPSVEKEIQGKMYRFFYVDGQLRYLAWQNGNVALWISNSLQNSLSEETMVQLATSFKPL
ncbi:MAG: LCP family protein [Actinomycetota bacterium]|nr:LCP family protein [Actinomycetota bacterium]MCL6093948.1 LCP family protein [Actinomycetota bacterium]MDA8166837.1 LCP family protein [Actinomycetota bacterium]